MRWTTGFGFSPLMKKCSDSWSSYWSQQTEVLFFGLYSDISGGQMPNKVTGSTDYLTVAGVAGSETYQCPNTADYIAADVDNIWFDAGQDQRTVTTAELIGYDLQGTPVKYGNTSPNSIIAIIILSSAVTGTQRDNLFKDMWLSPWWDDSFNVNGIIKDNRSGEQILFASETKFVLSRELSSITTRESGGYDYVSAITDKSIYGNDGSQTTEGYQPKLETIGLAFDGSDDFLDFDNDASLDFTTAMTVVIWAKTLDHTLANQGIITHGITDGQRSFTINFALHSVAPAEMSVLFYLTPNGTQASRAYIAATDASNANLIEDNTWYFIVCIYDNASDPKMKLYINNSAITVTTTGTPPTSIFTGSTENLVIGKGLNNPLKGSVDYVKLVNVALTTDEMTAIFNSTKSRYGY